MTQFFHLLLDYQEGNTVLLYCLIFIIGSFMAMKSQIIDKRGERHFKWFWFICMVSLLWAFYALNDVGTDTPHYRSLFLYYQSFEDCSRTAGEVELGFQYLCVILHWITKSEITAIIILRTIQLLIWLFAVYLLRNKISIGYSIMAYLAFYYFDSFNLLRSCLAGSICMLSLALFIRENTSVH